MPGTRQHALSSGTTGLSCRLADSLPQRFVRLASKTDKHLCEFRNLSVFGSLLALKGAGTEILLIRRPQMASTFRLANATIDPATDGALFAAVITSHECAYCQSTIISGQRWVREKIYEPSTDKDPHYRRFHADLFVDEGLSCWERHQMELETARAARTARRIM